MIDQGKWDRALKANKVIKVVSHHGERKLYSYVYDRVAKFVLDKYSQCWHVDCVTGMRFYPFGDGKWLGFTGDDETRKLVASLAQYIESGEKFELPADDPWQYGDDMKAVRRAVNEIIQGEK